VKFFVLVNMSESQDSLSFKCNQLSVVGDTDMDLGLDISQQPSTSSGVPSAKTSTRHNNLTVVDGEFFSIIQDKSDEVNVVARCRKCEPEVVEIKGRVNVSSNFVTHLKRKHGAAVLESYKNYIKRRKPEPKEGLGQGVCKKGNTNSLSQEEFTNLVTKFVISAMIPFRAVEDKWFLEIVSQLSTNKQDIKVPSRRTVIRNTKTIFDGNSKIIKSLLEKADYVCTTADIWSGKKRSFLGVTAHWIDENYDRQSAALACRRFKNPHNFSRIADLMQEINIDFGLNLNKVVATVTDNGSNFLKAFKEFGITEDAMQVIEYNDFPDDGERPDLLVNSDTNLLPEAQPSTSKSRGSSMLEEDGTDIFEITNENFPQAFSRALPQHVRCFSHSLNLCMAADLNKFFKDHTSAREVNKSVISKCTFLWNCTSRPKTAEVLEEVLGHTLSKPGVTRWNSFYDSLRQIINIKSKCPRLYRVLKCSKEQQLTEENFIYIEEYIECSAPIAQLLDILQGENQVFFGVLLPFLLALREKLRVLAQRSWRFCKPILESYKKSVETRFGEYFDVSSPIAETAAVAAFSHPAFKRRWLQRMDVIHHERLLQIFTSAVAKEIADSPTKPVDDSRTDHVDYLSYLDLGDDQEVASIAAEKETTAQLQVCNFFSNNSLAFAILNDYPSIRKIFTRTNAILPSSAPVERLFSFASMTNAPKCSKLSDENFEMRVILKSNNFRFC